MSLAVICTRHCAGIRDPLNVLIWAKSGPTLAVGSYRGNLMIYNHKTAKRVPVIGKGTLPTFLYFFNTIIIF